MRSAKLLLWVALAASGTNAQPTPPLPMFEGRDLRIEKEIPPHLRDSSTASNELRAAFASIRIDNSLMIRDCADWCANPAFAFDSILSVAGIVMNAGPEGKTWVDIGGPQRLPTDFQKQWAAQKKAPLHLLAVVNRIDLANLTRKAGRTTWEGAEVRFAYGANFSGHSGPRRITLIVEFQYKPLSWQEFKSLGKLWHTLNGSLPRPAVGDIQQLLSRVMRPGAFDVVRIRSNAEDITSQWHLHQWELRDGSGWTAAMLSDEIRSECFRKPGCEELNLIWDRLAKDNAIVRLPITSNSLLMTFQTYNTGNRLMPVIYGRTQTRPRNLLGLQQCSSCHLSETHTDFNHIQNRSTSKTCASLSKFLTGNKQDAAFEELPSARWVVGVTIECVSPPCEGPLKLERHFHDLGRRRLYFAALLAAPEQENAAASHLIMKYATDFSH